MLSGVNRFPVQIFNCKRTPSLETKPDVKKPSENIGENAVNIL